MSLSLILCFVWLIAANVIAMFPSRDRHWRAAYALIALGIPLVGWVTYETGPVWGLIMLAAGVSVLRWPVVYLWRWIKSRGRNQPGE